MVKTIEVLVSDSFVPGDWVNDEKISTSILSGIQSFLNGLSGGKSVLTKEDVLSALHTYYCKESHEDLSPRFDFRKVVSSFNGKVVLEKEEENVGKTYYIRYCFECSCVKVCFFVWESGDNLPDFVLERVKENCIKEGVACCVVLNTSRATSEEEVRCVSLDKVIVFEVGPASHFKSITNEQVRTSIMMASMVSPFTVSGKEDCLSTLSAVLEDCACMSSLLESLGSKITDAKTKCIKHVVHNYDSGNLMGSDTKSYFPWLETLITARNKIRSGTPSSKAWNECSKPVIERTIGKEAMMESISK
jgi:hypothetical protein